MCLARKRDDIGVAAVDVKKFISVVDDHLGLSRESA
jgi:hypothetical protein